MLRWLRILGYLKPKSKHMAYMLRSRFEAILPCIRGCHCALFGDRDDTSLNINIKRNGTCIGEHQATKLGPVR